MIVSPEDPYYRHILHHASKILAASSYPSQMSPGPALAHLYAFFLTVCTDMLGLDWDTPLACSTKLSFDHKEIADEVVPCLTRYRARWDATRIHLPDSETTLAQTEDLPVLFDIVIHDLQDIGVSVSFSTLASELSSFLKDLSTSLHPVEFPAELLKPRPSLSSRALPWLVGILILSIAFLLYAVTR